MIAPLIWKGVLKLVSIRKPENKSQNIARIYDPRSSVPEAIFNEVSPNCYKDELSGDMFKLLDGKMIAI